jgi:hypothetical protein
MTGSALYVVLVYLKELSNGYFDLKGRHTIRSRTPSGREPRHVEPWTFTPKENSTLHRLEKAYLDASLTPCPTASAMPISPRPVITLIRNCSEEERRRKRQIMHLAQTHQTLISNG